ncbi:FmdB family zinc ribbon protein [Thermodesulforhabdus norvegica]|uniref:Putative regulatory protein, FmdB family n=1 Tax=Thermodesulforhabdus norvegica TaxID=39841 RepID=A0A1I4U8Z2_9BACT|nr:zinc ribbon domain-containing protein [Thermodesulforhabdus norvegica]SFM85486.1 putative regulatory protein, FmdB family [Thermodesulforhabdus norvegica]
MPIYEFRCCSCDARFELLVLSQADAENVTCPSCGASNCERLVSRCFSLGMTGSSISGCGSQGFS